MGRRAGLRGLVRCHSLAGSRLAARAPRRSTRFGLAYLRDGEPLHPDEDLVEVLAVGDVMPGRGMAEVDGIFIDVADELRGADLALGNLEGAIGAAPAPGAGIPLLLPSKSPAALAAAGFDLLGLANNHSLDAGPAGLIETKRQLRRAGIEPIESDRPLFAEVDGTVFAFLAWNDLALPSRQALLESVRAADSAADQVIVLIHWGRSISMIDPSPAGAGSGALAGRGRYPAWVPSACRSGS